MTLETTGLTRVQVAWLVGMSDGWVRDRMQAGDFPRPGEPAPVYVQAMLRYRGTAKLENERTRLTSAQAEGVERKNRREAGELLPMADVILAGQSFVARSRARLLAIPSRAAPILAPMKSAAAIEIKLRELVCEALAELARLTTIADGNG